VEISNKATDPKESRATDLTSVTRSTDSGSGRITVNYSLPKGGSIADCLLIAHGVKETMNSALVKYFHAALATHGFLTVRFNFPYAEGRARLLRKPDKKNDLVECYRRVIEDAQKSQWKPRNLFLGGIALGAAVASHVIADGPDIPAVKGLFFLSYPIHRPGITEQRGDRHLLEISQPMLFVSGTRTIYAEPKVLKSTLSELGNKAQVYWVENGDHRFDKLKGKEIHSKTLQEIVETITQWVHSKTPTKTRTQ
jgi:uncharacterized protein